MENNLDSQYLAVLKDIMTNGVEKDTRSGKVLSVFDRTIRINLNDGFPVLTTKKVFLKGVIRELLWFLSGDTNIYELDGKNVHIWDDDAYRFYKETIRKHNEIAAVHGGIEYELLKKDDFMDMVEEHVAICVMKKVNDEVKAHQYTFGDLGDIYGKQWRKYGVSGRDQIREIISKLKYQPDDRRLILNGWNPDVLDEIALPACHVIATFWSRELSDSERIGLFDKNNDTNTYHFDDIMSECDRLSIPTRQLSCSFVCRSQDMFLGTPFNITSYALLTHMLAQCSNMAVGELIWHGMDCHIYKNHLSAVKEQISRDPYKYKSPVLNLNKEITDIDAFTEGDVEISEYESYPTLKAPLSVGN